MTDNISSAGYIFNIQRFTIHDGPGIRTEVFFKGCPLSCKWCSNPEGISLHPELGFYPAKCIGQDKCALCIKACPNASAPLAFVNGAVASAARDRCPAGCMACADACPASAIIMWGKEMTVDELLEIIAADRSLYQRSGGGVTLSGGEVMMQWEFARDLLRACKNNYIGTCIESALHCNWEYLEAVYKYTDLVITDIKHMDERAHKRYACVGNKLILENIKRTAALEKQLVVRIPVVPGYNDDDPNILATGAFIRDELKNRVVQVQLLPYRKMGVEKYDSLNRPYPMGDGYIPPERAVWEENLLRLASLLKDMGVPAEAGGNVKYSI